MTVPLPCSLKLSTCPVQEYPVPPALSSISSHGSATETVSTPLRPPAQAKDKARSCAERLQLKWPRGKRRVGRPTNQGRFEDELYKAITEQRWQELDKVTTSEVPSWWEPGMPLTLSPEEVEAKLCSEVVVPDKDDGPEEQEGEGQVAQPPLKRMHVDPAVKQWFLSWSLHMQKKPRLVVKPMRAACQAVGARAHG